MRLLKPLTTAALCCFVTSFAQADTIKGTGGPMNFGIGYGIQVNEGSSLQREWIIVNSKSLPVSLTGVSPQTKVNDRNWIYDVGYTAEVAEGVSAMEVRFIPFNIWGEKDRTLSVTEIIDLPAGTHSFSAQWRILSENNAVEHYAMLAYVAQVKLSSGQILRADPQQVVEVAQQFSSEFTSADLSKDD